MSVLPFYHRLIATLSICLVAFQPILNSSQLIFSSTFQENPLGFEHSSGSFENGLSYLTLTPTAESKPLEGAAIAISFPITPEEQLLAKLSAYAFFYGTEAKNREEISDFLNQLHLDIDPDTHINLSDEDIAISFVLDRSSPEEVQSLLEFACEMTLDRQLESNQIELAKQHLLNSEGLSDDEIRAIEEVRFDDLKQLCEERFVPKNLHLTVITPHDSSSLLDQLSDHFQWGERKATESLSAFDAQIFEALEESVDWNVSHKAYVIDGKIYMNEPDWINQASNGRTLGALLTAIGVGGIIIAIPLFAPLALLGGASAGAGLYLLFCPYLKDPYYIENARKQDLMMGTAYAYENQRAGLTLTPYERRFLFLNEIVNGSSSHRKPILSLADLYRLSDPIISELFSYDELHALLEIKEQFIQHRNLFKMELELLNQELNNAVAPFKCYRDESLDKAWSDYQHNAFVKTEQELKIERDQHREHLQQLYLKNEISLKEKEQAEKVAEQYYESRFTHPDFVNGLAAAKLSYQEQKNSIETNYTIQLELCKRLINYDERVIANKQGREGMVFFYNTQLINLCTQFPLSEPTLSDVLDLRQHVSG